MTLYIKNEQGFTLIELLVVVAIIGLISSIALTSMSAVRVKGRDARRKSDLTQMQKALELYFETNNSYPITSGWYGVCDACVGGFKNLTGANGYIPNLAPTYIGKLPVDPLGNVSGYSGYLYMSDGNQYKLLSHTLGPESLIPVGQPFYDPVRGGNAWMVCSTGSIACTTW